ncbi:MAG: molecular chaperone DnaK, partial [Planctomycetes bacterium]|nr:molecular chaperone DnaK [Planctomycetota bacterium]
MSKVVGIDLGTTKSVVSVVEGKDVKVIPNSEGTAITPSMVAFTNKGEQLVGVLAKRQVVTNPKNTLYEIKRFMGRKASEVQNEIKRVPYEVVGQGDDPVKVKIQIGAETKLFTPQEISAKILQELKRYAEDYIGAKISDAVITCPAYFNDSQRQATKEAGMIAGFEVKRIINEPTSASLAYGLDKKNTQKIAVYDLGGGTFDISILEIDKNVIQVLSTNGDTHLGGSDFDQRLINYVADEFQKQYKMDLRKDSMALQRLKDACEKAKCELSTVMETEINLPFISVSQDGPLHLSVRLSRAKFEELVDDLIQKTLSPSEHALKDAKLQVSDINEVVLVGGATRVPKIQQTVKQFFGRDPHKGINPEEVVSVGAAIQGAILSGEMKDILLLDVTPLTLGVETLGGIRTPMIKRNSPIPTKKTEVYSTAADWQNSVEIHIVQGERELANDCKSLGRFTLEGIPPSPRGVPKVEVSFEIDANGILNVSAKDLATNKQQSITVKGSTGLNQEEIDRMVKDAEKYSEEDKKRRQLIDIRNQAESMVYQFEKLITENKEKITD